jgi:polyphosphate kinase
MNSEIMFDEKRFDRMEKRVLKEVLENSKSMIETFKFRMIYSLNMDKNKENKTLKGLKEFRNKNWDSKLSKSEAYEEYMNLY